MFVDVNYIISCVLFGSLVSHSFGDLSSDIDIKVPIASPQCHQTRGRSSQGSFVSHDEYPSARYPPGLRCRYVINVPRGKGVEASVTYDNVKLRPYDYMMFVDGSVADKLNFICDTEKYTSLGTNGVHFKAILQKFMRSSKTIRGLKSNTSTIVVDFCVERFPYTTGSNDQLPGFWGFLLHYTSRPLKHLLISPVHSNVPLNFLPHLNANNQSGFLSSCGMPIQSPAAELTLQRIVHGILAEPFSWPWICALVLPKTRVQMCGCTLISDRWVVTAAHCFQNRAIFPGPYEVYLGVTDLRQAQSRNIYKVVDGVMHDEYWKPENLLRIVSDIAVLKLNRPVEFSSSIMPACLPTGSSVYEEPPPWRHFAPNANRICFVAGWGLMFRGQPGEAPIGSLRGGTDFLQQLAIEVFRLSDCMQYERQLSNIILSDNIICGGRHGGVYDSCQGDSGGPLVCSDTSGQWALHGIVSAGVKNMCADARAPGVYTHVAKFRDWIRNKTGV